LVNRQSIKSLDQWFRKANRKPLVLRGARQVGKSTLVREFARLGNLPLWEVNLEKHAGLNSVFATFEPGTVLRELSLVLNRPNVGKGPGVLFLDEIQQTPAALACLRYFYEEMPELAVVAAGSLLEFTLADAGYSMPVGRVEYHWLGPLTFFEFLEGAGETEALKYCEGWITGTEFSEAAHQRLCRRLREFFLVGGMPEAVQAFLDTGDFLSAVEVHRSILETYRDDFSKYSHGAELEKLRRVFEVLPRVLGRKVQYRQFHPDWKAQDIRRCLELLQRAGLALPVTHSHAQGLPLGADEDPTVFKLFFLDIGLVGTANGNALVTLEDFLESRFVNEGPLAEQFVAQHLWAHQPRDQRASLHFWQRDGKVSNAEVDFLIAQGSSILAIEVKSGTMGSLRSLHQFMLSHPQARALRLDLNRPSSQVVHTEIMTATGKQTVEYPLENRPLYFQPKNSFNS